VKGRKVFGGVVPYNQVWRIGEDAAATLHTDAAIIFRGFGVPKGDYTLYVLVGTDKWELIVSRQSGQQALVYDPKFDLGRVVMSLTKSAAPIETCNLTLAETTVMAGKLEIAWENTVASVPFLLDSVPDDSEWQ
jgi:hypothetical protein